MIGTIPAAPQQGHWCFGATLDCVADTLDRDAGLCWDNNKACVNIGILAGRVGQPVQVEFLAETPEDGTNPGGGSYSMHMLANLPSGWMAYLEYKPTGTWLPFTPGQPFLLNGTPGHDVPFRLTVVPPGAPFQGTAGLVRIEQYKLPAGPFVGGLDYVVVQDNVPPAAADDLVATAANFDPPEGQPRPGVLLSWTPPGTDVDGGPEILHYWEIHRSTQAAFTPDAFTLAAETACDEDSLTTGWQYTDRDTLLIEGVTYYYKVIGVDIAQWQSLPSNESGVEPLPLLDFADHDAGDCVLTVTDRGIVGFMDGSHAQGSGFVFPRDGDNLLYIGGPWVARDAGYVANRDYDADPAREWTTATDPDGLVRIDRDGYSAQDITAGFWDLGAPGCLQIHVRQESWAFREPGDDGFVILKYRVENRGASAVEGLYVGLFLDLDIGTGLSNLAAVEPTRRLAWVGEPGNVYAGLRLLTGDPDPDPVANLTIVRNRTHVWPLQHVADVDKFGLLIGAPGYVLTAPSEADDYSVLLSIGPVDLAPGQIDEVAFAIAGGADLASLLAASDRAQEIYAPSAEAPLVAGSTNGPTRLLASRPNPFRSGTRVGFVLEKAGDVRLTVHGPDGRLLRTLVDGACGAGSHMAIWDGRDAEGRRVSSGVYFLRLSGPGTESRARVLIMR